MPDETTPHGTPPGPAPPSPGQRQTPPGGGPSAPPPQQPQPPGGQAPPPPSAGAPPQAAPGPPPIVKEWYVSREGQQQGPYDMPQIMGWLQGGQLRPTDLCWKQGMASWATLGSMPEFAAVARSSSQAAAQFQAGMQTAKRATLGAISALKYFAFNPVGGLPEAYRAVGNAGALSAGIVYFVVYEIFYVLGLLALGGELGMGGPSFAIKYAVVLAVPFGGVFAALAGARILAGADATFHVDVFVAGIVSFVWAVLGLVIGVFLALQWVTPVIAVFVIANSYVILVLFSTVSRIYGVAESKAAWAVPAILIVASVLTYIIYRAMITSAFKSSFGSGVF